MRREQVVACTSVDYDLKLNFPVANFEREQLHSSVNIGDGPVKRRLLCRFLDDNDSASTHLARKKRRRERNDLIQCNVARDGLQRRFVDVLR